MIKMGTDGSGVAPRKGNLMGAYAKYLEKLAKRYPGIARCPYCNSFWVCWNWVYAYGGDRKAYEKANPHMDPKDLKDWGHECWDCEGVNETYKKVLNGIPHWFLKRFYSYKEQGAG